MKAFNTQALISVLLSIAREPISQPTFYLGHIVLALLFVFIMALIQLTIVLDIHWQQLSPRLFLIPALIGLVMGGSIAYLRLKQRTMNQQLITKLSASGMDEIPSLVEYRIDKASQTRIYLLYILLSSLGVFIFASLQMTMSLQIALSQLRPIHYIVPLMVGSLFGYLMASNSLLHKQLQNTLNIILKHEKALNKEIEEKNRIERSLREKGHELRALNKELESFNYTLSHDLRAPIRAVTGFSRILLDDYKASLDDTATDYLHRIFSAGQTMNKLVDGLLTLARVAHGELELEAVNLSQLSYEISENLRLENPGLDMEINITPGLIIKGDQRLLYSVMYNLLSNAWKYSAQASQPRIEFGCQRDNNGQLNYFVRDNGIGFESELKDQIFQGFQRAHDSAGYEGTGIGLATVKRIIKRHGGKIWAEGTPNQGACFYFTLPAIPASRIHADSLEIPNIS